MLKTFAPPPNIAKPSMFYQGCGTVIKGHRCNRTSFLDKIEASARVVKHAPKHGALPSRLTHIIEPKSDGIWVAIISDEHGDSFMLTKTGAQKTPDDMLNLNIVPNSIVVGELAGGSQQSLADIREHGCTFVKLFDILRYAGKDVTVLTLLKRKCMLRKFFHAIGSFYPDSMRCLIEMEMWSTGLVSHYNKQPEGLIAKEIDDGPYVIGSKNKAWIKVKKCFSDDYVITGWTRSTAATKVGRGTDGMAESVTVAGWVPADEVTIKDNVRGVTKIGGMDFTLVDLMFVGAMSDEMATSVASNFSYWRGKVVRIGHYKLFKSGAGRHPFILSDEHGLAMLAECRHSECLYRMADREGGREL